MPEHHMALITSDYAAWGAGDLPDTESWFGYIASLHPGWLRAAVLTEHVVQGKTRRRRRGFCHSAAPALFPLVAGVSIRTESGASAK